MKYYTMTAVMEGEAYHYMGQFKSMAEGIEKLGEKMHAQYCEDEEMDIEIDEMPAMWIVSVVVTADKPERFGEAY